MIVASCRLSKLSQRILATLTVADRNQLVMDCRSLISLNQQIPHSPEIRIFDWIKLFPTACPNEEVAKILPNIPPVYSSPASSRWNHSSCTCHLGMACHVVGTDLRRDGSPPQAHVKQKKKTHSTVLAIKLPVVKLQKYEKSVKPCILA